MPEEKSDEQSKEKKNRKKPSEYVEINSLLSAELEDKS